VKKLTLAQAALIGIAGNAPSYSLAVTTGALIAAVGGGAPLVLAVCSVITLGIVLAYARMNREQPSAGAAYAWAGNILHPAAGFFAGWCVMASALIFMISALLPAATATLMIFAPQSVDDKAAVIAVGMLWLAAVTAVVARGTEWLGKVQSLLTLLEIGMLCALAVGAFAAAAQFDHGALRAALSSETWSVTAIAKALVIGLFFYWGWDVIFNLAEETRATRTVSAGAGMFALAVLTAIFVFFAAVMAVTLSPADLQAAGGNALLALADNVLPRPFGSITLLVFLLSVIGGTEACIVSFSRTALAEARDRRLWAGFGRLTAGAETPALAAIVAAIIAAALLLAGAAFETVDAILRASINVTAIIVTAYYGMAAIACALHAVRRGASGADLCMYVVWPLASAAIFAVAALIALTEMDTLTLATLAGIVVLGLGVFVVHRPGRA
jgi:amino acid transporter